MAMNSEDPVPASCERAGSCFRTAVSVLARWRSRRCLAAPALARQASLHLRGSITSSICSWPADRASWNCSITSRSCRSGMRKPTPDSFLNGKRFAFMDTFSKEKPKLLGTRREFKQYGKSGHLGFRSAAEHRVGCRRYRCGPWRFHRELQSRPGEAVHQYRIGAARTSEHGLVDQLRHRQRLEGSARLCGSAVGPSRASRRRGAMVQRLPADVRTRAFHSARLATRFSICRTRGVSTRPNSVRRWTRSPT